MNKKGKTLVVILATAGISLVGVLLIIIVWMNLTPGYFRYGKDCRIDYFANNEVNRLPTGLENCSARAVGSFLLSLAKLDFNKGSSFSGVDGNQPITAPPAFTCPETGWVDCLPGPGPVKAQCQKEYLDWATKSCPNFQGAAY